MRMCFGSNSGGKLFHVLLLVAAAAAPPAAAAPVPAPAPVPATLFLAPANTTEVVGVLKEIEEAVQIVGADCLRYSCPNW